MCLPHNVFQRVNLGNRHCEKHDTYRVCLHLPLQDFYAKLKAGVSNFQMTRSSEIQKIFSNAKQKERERERKKKKEKKT